MFTRDANQEIDTFIVIHWLLMSVCAGILNAIAFIGLGTFATHVTGFATLFGVHTATLHIGNALAALAVPLFFLAGAVISGLGVEARVRQGKVPHYDYVMYFCSFLLVLACIIGGVRGDDDTQSYLHLERNFFLLSLICMSSGLVNAALSYSSHSTVRITHLTGVTTDLGRGIAEFISLTARGIRPTKQEFKLNFLRIMTITSFVIGSVIGAFFFNLVSFYTLLLPAAYFVYAGEHGRKIKNNFRLLESKRGDQDI